MSITAGLLLLAAQAGAAPDCPLGREPYSSRSPVADLMLDPAAKAATERAAPGLLAPPPGVPADAAMRGFGRIVTPAHLLQGRPDGAETARRLDAALAKVPVTEAATRARCAGYDSVPPALPMIRRPAILVFSKITGFRHVSAADASAAFKAMGERRGWSVVETDNGAVFNARDLARFDAVVWNNVSGDALTLAQRAAFRRWIERGGGFAGVHGSGGDPVWFWDWYADTLLGARFTGHPMSPQFQKGRLVVEPGGAITAGLPREWTLTEEWYSFARSPRGPGTRVHLTLDERSYRPDKLAMGDHPIAWTRCVGNGRSFYSAIGHRPENYKEPNSLRLLEQGIAWAAGLGDTRCANGREVTKREKAR